MKCPHCGYDADPGQEECPLCGTPLEKAVESGEVGVEAGGRTSASAESAAGTGERTSRELTPWEAGGGAGALVDSWWESLSEPGRFFSRVDWQGGLERPVLYYLVFSVLGSGLGTVWYTLLGPSLSSALGNESVGAVSGMSPVLQFFLSPFTALVGLGVGAVAAHIGARLLSSRPGPLRATARTLCYAAGPQVLNAVPFVGGFFSLIWSSVLIVLGLRTAHDTSTLRAVGMLFVAFLLLSVAMFFVGVAIFVADLGGALPFPVPSAA